MWTVHLGEFEVNDATGRKRSLFSEELKNPTVECLEVSPSFPKLLDWTANQPPFKDSCIGTMWPYTACLLGPKYQVTWEWQHLEICERMRDFDKSHKSGSFMERQWPRQCLLSYCNMIVLGWDRDSVIVKLYIFPRVGGWFQTWSLT